MSVIGSNIIAGSSGQFGYNLDKSLRLRSSASAYLSRTPASATDRQKFTFSAWIKRGALSTNQHFISAGSGGTQEDAIYFNASGNILGIYAYQSGSYAVQLETTQVFRDISAWYHIVVAVDTTQATSSNRIKMYVNGNQITSFSVSTYPSLNFNFDFNNTQPHNIGRNYNNNSYFDGYLAETNFIDGQALTPSSFGANNASTGVWQPKKYAGTYGTNGFYLSFKDNSSTTTLGYDDAGSNDWTCNNISLTAGSTYDSMTDVPTLTSATASNFAVLNPLKTYLSPTISNGNLQASSMAGGSNVWGTMAVSTGKWYFETTITAAGSPAVGIIDANRNASEQTGYTASGSASYISDGRIRNNNANSGGGAGTYATFTTNDVIGVAFDCDAPSVSFYKNNTLQATVTPTSGIAYTIQLLDWNAGTSGMAANFGQRPFAYTPPTGFVALNTFNLPTPTIGATASTQANKYFDATLYTGNGSTQSIVNAAGFSPDLVWVKQRNGTGWHILTDSVRGANKQLYTNATNSEGSDTALITALNSNGFSVGYNGGTDVNGSGSSYVAWQWDANGAGVSNTAGSITSTVSANTSAGFSVVTYTGNGTAGATVGHGLGVAPKMIIVKNRGNSSPNWVVYHESLGTTGDSYLGYPEYYLLQLADTSGKYDFTQDTIYDSNSNTFRIGSSGVMTQVNASSATYVAYCFSEVAGYSKMGSYTGNGSANGTFVYTGFRPKFIMVKRTDSTGFWTMMDSSRSPFNVADDALYANASNAESTPAQNVDFTSNGFKFRSTDSDSNSNGGTHVYMAFAENPFKYSLGK
jgi:hypothetical protein